MLNSVQDLSVQDFAKEMKTLKQVQGDSNSQIMLNLFQDLAKEKKILK